MNHIKISKKEIISFSVLSILFLSIPFIVTSNIPSDRNFFEMRFFWKMMLEYFILWVFFMVNYFYLIPQFYFNKKYIFYFISVIGFILMYLNLPGIIIEWLPFESMNRSFGSKDRGMRRFPIYLIWTSKILIFACTSFVALFLRNNKRLQEVKEEKQMSEIAYLRSQINPHFLFNTLNNIYALTLQKSDAAPDAVLKLSKMMRFMVSESSKEEIDLQQDLEYLKNYIQLQKMRLADTSTIQFSIQGATNGLKIAPLLLINYIENAFKYGVIDEVEHPIVIQIFIKDDQLLLEVKNKISDHELRADEKSMTGLMNVKKRLDYLYANRYDLKINETNDFYEVKLNLKLND